MFPAVPVGTAALLGGALNFAGGMMQNHANSAEAQRNREFQGRMFDAQVGAQHAFMDRANDHQWSMFQASSEFNREMANTAYQRGMRDMEKAGLNPILAFKQGGASAPTMSPGSSAMGSAGLPGGATARMENVMSGAVQSAMQGARLVQEVQQQAANIDQTRAQTDLAREQATQVSAQGALQRAQAITEGVRPDLIRQQAELYGAQTQTERRRPALVDGQTAQALSASQYNATGALVNIARTGLIGAQETGQRLTNTRAANFGDSTIGREAETIVRGGTWMWDQLRRAYNNIIPHFR